MTSICSIPFPTMSTSMPASELTVSLFKSSVSLAKDIKAEDATRNCFYSFVA